MSHFVENILENNSSVEDYYIPLSSCVTSSYWQQDDNVFMMTFDVSLQSTAPGSGRTAGSVMSASVKPNVGHK